jgi:hypothetical protein
MHTRVPLLCIDYCMCFYTMYAILHCIYVQPNRPADATEFAKFELAAESRQIMSSTQMDWLTNNIKTS